MMKKTWRYLVAILPPLLACGADGTSDAQEQSAGAVLARAGEGVVDIAAIRPIIDNLTSAGTLCPEGTAKLRANDGSYDVSLSRGELTSLPGGSGSAACTLDFDVLIPEGVRLTRAPIAVQGGSFLERGGEARLSVRYAVNGGAFVQGTKRSLTAADEAWTAAEDASSLDVSTCGATAPTKFRYSVEVTLTAADGAHVDVFNVGGRFRDAGGARYAACSGATDEPTLHLGDTCNLSPDRVCAPDLICDVRASSVEDGYCVARDERVLELSDIGHECGGKRSIACKPEAICHYPNSGQASRKLLGVCVSPIASKVGDTCGGTPDVACQGDLTCVNDRCTFAEGGRGDLCDPRGRTCIAPLTCNEVGAESRCGRSVTIGGSCDALDQCGPGLACDAQTSACTPLNPGQERSRCRPGIDSCNEGLVCKSSRMCLRP